MIDGPQPLPWFWPCNPPLSLVQLWYISDPIISLFWEPAIRKQDENVIPHPLLPECLTILLPELVYYKVKMVPAVAHGLEWGEGVGCEGSKGGTRLATGQLQHSFLLLEGKSPHGKQLPGASFVFSLLKSVCTWASARIFLKLQLSVLELRGKL